MKEFENERKRLVLGINNQADAKNLATYVMAEIGKDGDELLRRVDRLITAYAEPLADNSRRRLDNIDASLQFQKAAEKKVFTAVGKVGGKLGTWLAGQSTRALADTILMMYDGGLLISQIEHITPATACSIAWSRANTTRR